jgi:hypothetical protein
MDYNTLNVWRDLLCRLCIATATKDNYAFTVGVNSRRVSSIQLLTGSEDNSCCSRNYQSITDLLYLIIFNAFYFNFFSCF